MMERESVMSTQTIDATWKEAVETLRSSMRGRLVLPEHPDYDDIRSVRNGLIDRRPAVIARCRGTADVVAAVAFAREHELLLSVRGGGHNVAGNAVNDGGIVIDLSEMPGVLVDPEQRTVRAQGGAAWGDVDRETQLFGLATPGGLVSSTGIAGLTLHGGLGWLRRKHGLCLDNLVSIEIVTADGQARTASESTNSDLFWAIRGAGSNFGAVTMLEYRLHPVGPLVTMAALLFPLHEAETVLRRYREFTRTADRDVTAFAAFWSVPSGEPFPETLWGTPVVMVAAIHSGEMAEGERVIEQVRGFGSPLLDLSTPIPYAILQSAFDGFFPKGWLYYWKSLYLTDLTDEAIDAIVDLGRNRPSPSTAMPIWQLGGAIADVPADATAFGRRDHPFLLSIESTWTDPADTDRCIGWTRDAWSSMQRFGPGGLYLNFAGFGEEKEVLVRAGYGDNYDRLATLKAMYDPDNLFRMNQNIRPAMVEAAD
jgi:FAD/FMN-containing dehydrogenase